MKNLYIGLMFCNIFLNDFNTSARIPNISKCYCIDFINFKLNLITLRCRSFFSRCFLVLKVPEILDLDDILSIGIENSLVCSLINYDLIDLRFFPVFHWIISRFCLETLGTICLSFWILKCWNEIIFDFLSNDEI